MNREDILKILSAVPDHGSAQNIVDAGRIARLDVLPGKIMLDVEVTNPALHIKKKVETAVRQAISNALGNTADLSLNIIFNAESRRKDGRKVLPGVKNIIAVASGKGGVGKSTVTANLAVALTKMGARVGLVDADIYGPSVPIMFDVQFVRPEVRQAEDGRTLIVPVENYGVKMLSIGFFADVNQAVAWRGPMASKALTQMFVDADWGELDYLLIDLPPGTGDIHLTLVQAVPLSGVVIVSTPQDVALADARKGVAMFQMPNINIPVLGMVENMAWFTPAELPDHKYYIFGKDGLKKLAEELEVPVLGEIPLVQSIRESGDAGYPIAMQESDPVFPYFMELAEKMVEKINVDTGNSI